MSVTTATPVELACMLCERAILDVDQAVAAERDGHAERSRRSLRHARDIVSELLASLDHERGGAIAENLAALYVFSLQRLVPPASVPAVAAVRAALASICEGYRAIRRGGSHGRM
jgi:flagellar protein FliS